MAGIHKENRTMDTKEALEILKGFRPDALPDFSKRLRQRRAMFGCNP